MLRAIVSLILCLPLLSSTTGPALAHILFCNSYNRELFVSLAYEQFDRNEKTIGWLARGWLSVPIGTCGEFDSALAVQQFYWRIETGIYIEGSKGAQMTWPGTDTGDKYFWTFDGSFQLYGAEKRPGGKPILKPYKRSAYSQSGPISIEITIDKDAAVLTSYLFDSSGGSKSDGNEVVDPFDFKH